MIKRWVLSVFVTYLLCCPVLHASSSLKYIEEGIKAPNFILKDLKHEPVELYKFSDKITVVLFWAVWCEPCVKAMNFLNDVYVKRKRYGLEVIGVLAHDEPENAIAFVEQSKNTLQILVNEEGVFDAYKNPQLPICFILDKDKVILRIYKDFKPSDYKDVEAYLTQLTSI